MYTYRIRGKRGRFKIILPLLFVPSWRYQACPVLHHHFQITYIFIRSWTGMFMRISIATHKYWLSGIVHFLFFGKIMQKQILYFSWFSESVCLIISARIVFRFVRRLAATSPIRSEDTFFFPGLQIRSAVRSPASCEIGNGTYSWKFAPAISPVSLQAPKDGIRLPQSVTYLPYPSPHHMAFLLSREGLCPRNSIFSLKK